MGASLPPTAPNRKDMVLSRLRQAALLAALYLALYAIGTRLPPGFDWNILLRQGVPAFWMPWTEPILAVLSLPSLFALTLIGVGVRTRRCGPSPIALALALVSLPTLWVLFLGNLDGLAVLGLVLLPWAVPLVLLKPQVASFALLSRPNRMVAAAVWLAVSLLLWGPWPLQWSELMEPGWRAEWVQDISLFPWGLLVALPLLWFSRGDDDLLMAAGSLGTPHLFPYHFIVLMPALARMKPGWMVATWLISWTPLLANWLGPAAWHFGNLLSVFFWVGIYLSRPRRGEAAEQASPSPSP